MYDRLLVPLDGSELAECVLPHVSKLSRCCGTKEVTLLRVCEIPVITSDYEFSTTWGEQMKQLTKYNLQQCNLYLEGKQNELNNLGIPVKIASFLGIPADAIIDYAEKNGIDLIIMASHGRSGIRRWAYGSIAEKVFRSTCVPVLMVRAPGCLPGIK